jgi:hypothetical protein
MRVWRWQLFYKDFEDERITSRALSGIWLSKSDDDDVVQDEIHDYLAGQLEVDPESVTKLNVWEDDEKYDLG